MNHTISLRKKLNIVYHLDIVKYYVVILGFIYLPHLKIGGLIVNTLFLYLIIGIYICATRKKIYFQNNITIILSIQIIYLSFSNVYNGYIETPFWKQFFIFILLYQAAHAILRSFFKRYDIELLMKIILWSLIFNSIIILFFSVFRDYNIYLHNLIHVTPKQSKYIYDRPFLVRHSGIAVSGFSYLSFKVSCLFAICVVYAINNESKSNLVHVTFFLLALSLIFVARTGLLITIISYLLFLFYTNKKLLLFLTIIFISLTSLLVGRVGESEDNIILSAFERSFDLFLSDEKNSSLVVLEDEASNTKVNNILLGDGDYGRKRGLITDIGYLSFLKGGGILGLIVLTAHWFYLIANSCKKLKRLNKTSWLQYAMIFVVFLHLVFSFKELVFYGHGYIQSIIILLILDGKPKY